MPTEHTCSVWHSLQLAWHIIQNLNPQHSIFFWLSLVTASRLFYNVLNYSLTSFNVLPKFAVINELQLDFYFVLIHDQLTKGCPPPKIPNMDKLQPYSDLYKYGQIVSVHCKGDFYLEGTEVLVCTNKNTWHRKLPECIREIVGEYIICIQITPDRIRRSHITE